MRCDSKSRNALTAIPERAAQTGMLISVIPPMVMSAIVHAKFIGMSAPTKTISTQKA